MQGPIPGQSLTTEPGAAPYEKPPRFNTAEEAFEAYLDKFDSPDTQDAFFQILENGVPLNSVVNLLTRQAVNSGVHSVDLSIVLRPIVHQYLSVLADSAGVTYDESMKDKFKDKELSKKKRLAIASRVNKQLESREDEPEDDLEMAAPEPKEEAPEQMEMELPAPEPAKKGLMQRPKGMM